MASWTMGGLDFMVLCSRFGRDRLPYPLAVDIDVDTADHYQQLRREAAARVDALLNEDLDVAMRTMVDPIARIEYRGESADSSAKIARAHASVRHDIAVVLTQRPGTGASSGGAVTMELTSPALAPTRILGSLPYGVAGNMSARHLEPQSATAATVSSGARMSTATRRSSAAEEFRSFFDRPRTAGGEVIVARGKSYDNRRDTDAISFFWMDFQGDGRYIVHSRDSVEVVPADTARVASEISEHLAVALRR